MELTAVDYVVRGVFTFLFILIGFIGWRRGLMVQKTAQRRAERQVRPQQLSNRAMTIARKHILISISLVAAGIILLASNFLPV
jgi:hypothetical protein